jgi:hypothetical protein
MRPGELDEQLGWRDVDEGDLDAILTSHFDLSRYESGDRAVDYFRQGEHVLTFRFRSRDLTPATMEPGSALSGDDVAGLVARFARTRDVVGVGVHRRLLYSYVIPKGFWQYSGRLGRVQLLPPPASAPDIPAVIGDHPLVLEYEVASCGDNIVDQARVARAYRRYALVLSGLVTHVDVPDRERQVWAYVSSCESPSGGASAWVQAAYWIMGSANEDIPGWRADFSSLEGLERMVVLPHEEFHSRRGIGPDDEYLAVPETLADSLDRFATLDSSRQDQFLRAAYWLNHARRVWDLSYSASFIAVAQAIEALLPEASTVYCNSCGISHDEPSISKRFLDWVDANAPADDARKLLYPLRSGLVHSSALLANDMGVHGLQPRTSTERDTAGLARRAAQLGLTNWLRNQV